MKFISNNPLVLTAFFIALLAVPAFGQAQSSDMNLSLSDILSIESPKVISASKTETTVAEAPSIITVYTDKDIKRMGVRSVRELLERTVGFYSGQQYSNPILGDRGIIADGNAAWLMLIDEHNVNSTVMHGMQSQYVFPLLNNVKRVEIVRGPGSTLWGSDAALGIIHIFTKTGADVKGTQIIADMSADEHGGEFSQHYGFITGDTEEDGKYSYMTSFDWMKAAGYPDGPNYAGLNGQAGYTVPFDSIRDSYQLFSKFNIGEHSQLLFRNSDLQLSRQWTATSSTPKLFTESDTRYNRQRTVSSEFKHIKKFDETSSLTFKMFGGMQDFNQQFAAPYYNTGENYAYDLWSHEFNYGTEFMYTNQFADWVTAKFGTRLVRTEYDPILNGTFTQEEVPRTLSVVASPKAIDESNSVYTEADFKITKDFKTTAGLRYDTDLLRDEGAALLPRLGLIYRPVESDYTAKYLYNTGYVRPPTNFGFFGQNPTNPFYNAADPSSGSASTILYGADKSERIESHDLQFAVNQKRSNYSVTLYQTTLDNYFLYSGELFNSNAGRLWIVNAGTIVSRGLELEAKHTLTNTVSVNGNFSYTFSSKFNTSTIYNSHVPGGSVTPTHPSTQDPDGNITGMPKWIANIGADYAITEKLTLDGNVHLLAGAIYQDNLDSTQYHTEPIRGTLDAALNYSEGEKYSASVFAHNILGNTYRAASVTQGDYQVQGFDMGVIGKYLF